jgi:hypothetical protein
MVKKNNDPDGCMGCFTGILAIPFLIIPAIIIMAVLWSLWHWIFG